MLLVESAAARSAHVRYFTTRGRHVREHPNPAGDLGLLDRRHRARSRGAVPAAPARTARGRRRPLDGLDHPRAGRRRRVLLHRGAAGTADRLAGLTPAATGQPTRPRLLLLGHPPARTAPGPPAGAPLSPGRRRKPMLATLVLAVCGLAPPANDPARELLPPVRLEAAGKPIDTEIG